MNVLLTVTAGPHRGAVFSFEEHDSFIVGRSKKAQFRLPQKDRYFSRVHFLIEVNPPLCRVVDLNSRNGTKVNGEAVLSAILDDGDLIQAGRSELQVRIESTDGLTVPGLVCKDASVRDVTQGEGLLTPPPAVLGAGLQIPPVSGPEVFRSRSRADHSIALREDLRSAAVARSAAAMFNLATAARPTAAARPTTVRQDLTCEIRIVVCCRRGLNSSLRRGSSSFRGIAL